MDKSRFLKIAGGIRKERSCRSMHGKPRTFIGEEHSVVVRFKELARDLAEPERFQLLQSLMISLERERRRCKGRKNNYDPGRHISLYIAIKELTAETKKLPE
jgi:hypothetical protein